MYSKLSVLTISLKVMFPKIYRMKLSICFENISNFQNSACKVTLKQTKLSWTSFSSWVRMEGNQGICNVHLTQSLVYRVQACYIWIDGTGQGIRYN